MNKSTKGALAATAAGFLLLGGAGSLAYWSDSDTATGATIESGSFALTDADCQGWELDGGTALSAGVKVVPGDTVTQTCTYAVAAEGEHLTASFSVSNPTWATGSDASLVSELGTPTATYQVNGASVTPPGVAIEDGDVITAEVSVTFGGAGATNASQSDVATLNDITITATQGHG